MQPAIRVENLGKRYRISHEARSGERGQYRTLRESLTDAAAAPFRRMRSVLSTQHSALSTGRQSEDFWALKDVSFEVQPGEVVGIIGRNGAGKSTLLKILSRITKPTTGQVKLRGRVASLLEVGTGFHPELTGRENVYLNGSILGMSRSEIARRFDEIVAFAEVEKFLDTPVKRYSSGMYVRLAFAVAAHLNPGILIVDEVLAVGDAEFQRKCIGKMRDVANGGRTIVFVSHNMAAVKSLCTRAVLLRSGTITATGSVAQVVSEYAVASGYSSNYIEWASDADAPGNQNISLHRVRISCPERSRPLTIDSGVDIEISFSNYLAGINLDCTVYVSTSDAVLLFESGCIISTENDARVGRYTIKARIGPHILNARRYFVSLVFGKDQYYELFRCDDIASFALENTSTGRGRNMNIAPGVIRPLLSWIVDYHTNGQQRHDAP